MSCPRSLAIVLCFILALVVFLPAARADKWNQKTEMTFSEPIEVPGVVLPAGTYWFVLFDDQSNRQIVRIFSSDGSKIFATLYTMPMLRAESTNRTEMTFAARLHSQPEAILYWYYPGLLVGHEFVYPTKQENELTRDAKRNVVVRPINVASNPATPGE